MRLLIIRHGDPDYARDNLTEKGKREAKLLSEMLAKSNDRLSVLLAVGPRESHLALIRRKSSVWNPSSSRGCANSITASIFPRARKSI